MRSSYANSAQSGFVRKGLSFTQKSHNYMMKKSIYEKPAIESLDCRVEQGFAGSGEPATGRIDLDDDQWGGIQNSAE